MRLYHFEDLSHAEIAARLGIPMGTVKSRSHRAHRRLAHWLSPLLVTDSEPTEGDGATLSTATPERGAKTIDDTLGMYLEHGLVDAALLPGAARPRRLLLARRN